MRGCRDCGKTNLICQGFRDVRTKDLFFQQEFEECDSNHIQATAASTDLGDL